MTDDRERWRPDGEPPTDTPPPAPPAALPAPPAPKDLPRAWPEAWDEPLPPPPPPPPPPPDPNARYAPGYRDTRNDPAGDRPVGDPQHGPYPPGAYPPSDPWQPRVPTDPTPTTDLYAPGYEPTVYAGGAPYPPGAYPPPPPPPDYRPPYEAPTPARGVTFKRREEPSRRGLAVPVAAVLLLLVGGGLIIWLLAGNDRRPPPSVSPSPTQGGVFISPSGSPSPGETPATDEPSGEPSPSEEPSASDEPSPSGEPSPSEEPSPTGTPTPEPTVEPTVPPTTVPPTSPPTLPTPVPTDPPPGIDLEPGETALKVALSDAAFNGGRSGEYHGRSARWVYGQGTDDHTMSARFIVTGSPVREARLRIDGLDGEDQRRTPIRIRVNGETIFSGVNPLENDVCCGSGGEGNWSAAAFDFNANLLKPGENRITISNMAPSGRVGVPFVMLDDARLLYIVNE